METLLVPHLSTLSGLVSSAPSASLLPRLFCRRLRCLWDQSIRVIQFDLRCSASHSQMQLEGWPLEGLLCMCVTDPKTAAVLRMCLPHPQMDANMCHCMPTCPVARPVVAPTPAEPCPAPQPASAAQLSERHPRPSSSAAQHQLCTKMYTHES